MFLDYLDIQLVLDLTLILDAHELNTIRRDVLRVVLRVVLKDVLRVRTFFDFVDALRNLLFHIILRFLNFLIR